MTLNMPLLLLLLVAPATAQESPGRGNDHRFSNDRIVVGISPRTPDQMAAFYEGRGFPPAMIAVLRQQCFMTVGIRNRTRDILWLELEHWRFSTPRGEVRRLHRNEWKQRWEAMQIPLASQSTFRWTLLPETLDFRPDEGEGGNIILPRDGLPYDITATFKTGGDRLGEPVVVQFKNVKCAED